MAAVPSRWLDTKGKVVAYSDEAGALYIRDDVGEFFLASNHGQVGPPEDGVPGTWLDDHVHQQGDHAPGSTKYRPWLWQEFDPAEEDPVITSIVMAIPEDIKAIYIIAQRLSHVLSSMELTRETVLARTKLQEAAMWMGAAIHVGGVTDGS